MMGALALSSLATVLTAPSMGEAGYKAVGQALAQIHADEFGTEIEVVVDPEGRPLSCNSWHSEGSLAAVKALCVSAMRLKWKPAIVNYQPVYGRARETFAAVTRPHNLTFQPKPDLEIEVATLPKKLGRTLEVPLVAYVDGGGRIVECQGQEGKYSQYASVGCTQLSSKVSMRILYHHSSPISYVANFMVHFRASGADKEETSK